MRMASPLCEFSCSAFSISRMISTVKNQRWIRSSRIMLRGNTIFLVGSMKWILPCVNFLMVNKFPVMTEKYSTF
ncbi:hypothetical protein GDO81_021961 [Engystomops pustulosus]|uniref:Uncharacterized protein n=1 Tax=Engystomops pustulosus TaxID=76066 RepID=A0AAV6ZIL2_ENGPU|nr:hypothetical protein GDO81_021961 [Engystomops pustulosus]